MKVLSAIFDKLIFLIALGLLCFAGYKVYQGLQSIDSEVKAPNKSEKAPIVASNDYQNVMVELTERFKVVYDEGEDQKDVFIAEKRITCINTNCHFPIPYDLDGNTTLICPECETTNIIEPPSDKDRDLDGMPNEWERDNGLDPDDPSDKWTDLDGDLFPNFVEFESETLPQLDNSHPPYVDYLFVERAQEKVHPILLRGYNPLKPGVYRFQIKIRKWEGGMKLEEEQSGYKLISQTISEVKNEATGKSRKVVTLTVKHLESGQTFELSEGDTVKAGVSAARLKSTLTTNFSMVVQSIEDASFKFRPTQGAPYKVKAIRAPSVEVDITVGDSEEIITLGNLAMKSPDWLDGDLPGAVPGYGDPDGGMSDELMRLYEEESLRSVAPPSRSRPSRPSSTPSRSRAPARPRSSGPARPTSTPRAVSPRDRYSQQFLE